VRDVVASAFLLIGALLNLLAAIGLLRFPDVFARMHAATKPATLGLLCILIGAGLLVPAPTVIAFVLVAALQLLTVPIGGHVIGRAAHRAGVPMSDATVVELGRDGSEGDSGCS
jgi:multicomponent Na+:H+ antiporter subunit G